MASDVVYGAIRAHLEAYWHATPIAWENEAFDQPSAGEWLLLEITGTSYAQQDIGAAEQADNRWDEEGQLWLHVFGLAGTGSMTIRRHAKQVADLFRGTLLLNDALEFGDAAIGMGEPGNTSGTTFRVSVAIDWRHMSA